MKTEAVYEKNSYLKSLKAKILDIRYNDNIEVLFDKTIFYPEGGGQPSDVGFIVGNFKCEKRSRNLAHSR